MSKITLFRITTVPLSLEKLLSGQMKYMSQHGFKVVMISSDFDNKSILEEKENSKFVPVEMTRKISPLSDLRALYLMIVVMRKYKPIIVHTHTPKAGLIGMLASKLVGVPIRLHTVAGLPLMETRGLKRFLLEWVEKLTYFCALKVYPNSKALRDFIVESGFTNPKKLKVIGNGSSNGINSEEFKSNEVISKKVQELGQFLNVKSSDFVFVFVGRLVKDKGIEELIESFHLLCTKYSEIKLLLVGPEERHLDPLSKTCYDKINLNSNIIKVGYQSDVRPYLKLSNALVFPSYREGFPNVPMQAGCFNLPSIVTNINGCNEIIVNGENGLIVPVKDVHSLTKAMEEIYINKELYEKMKLNSRTMIVERYEQNVIWELILNEYNTLLQNINP